MEAVSAVGPALILGGASCLHDDLAKLEELVGGPWSGIVCATNDAGYDYPHPIDHWVTQHPEHLPDWMEKRRLAGYDMDFTVWGGVWRTGRDDRKYTWVDQVLRITRVGSSGMHAVEVALHLGAERIVLCGVPMDFRPHFFNPRQPWNSPSAHWDAWTDAAPEWADRVRSFTGWTAELLGTPDEAWLSTSPALGHVT